MTGTDLPYDPT